MSTDVVMPRLSDTMEEGTIVKWLKQVGDHPIKVALHADVVVTITVSVLGEQ